MTLQADHPAPATDSATEFGRQPPQDLDAEQSALGGMLLSKDAIADVLEKLRPGDFYLPSHQLIYEVILDLYGRGEPADSVTVAAELDRRGKIRRIGGAPYLHTLISRVPTAANAGYYAGIVAEKALLRWLVDAGTRVVQYGYAGAEGADVADVVDRAQAEQDADMVLLIHRPEQYERDSPRAGEADLILAKHRNGPVAEFRVASILSVAKFAPMPRGGHMYPPEYSG